MKKIKSLIIFPIAVCIILCVVSFFGCKKNEALDLSENQTYTVNYLVNEGGSIFGLSSQTIISGEDSEEVVAIPDVGYEFIKWSDGLETADRIETDIKSDLSVTAIFKKLCYTVKYETGGNGYIEGKANQAVAYNESAAKVTAVPNIGYQFVKWSDGLETAERTDKGITADKTIRAIFNKLNYTVKYETDGNGYIEGKATQAVAYNESAAKVTAVPNIGYQFVKWSDGLETANRIEKDIKSDLSLTAIFKKLNYTVKYETDGNGYIVGKENQSVEYGDNGTKVTAIPNNGYKFVKWSDGITNDVRQDLNVKDSVTVIAEFEFLFADGNGERYSPFIIETYQQLLSMRDYPDQHYRLANDLDLNGISHEPIFDDNEPFSGYFEGNGKTINNLTVATDKNYPSLFGFIFGGIVINLNISNVNITTTDFNTQEAGTNYCVGVIAGYSVGFLNNISVDGEIKVDGLTYDGVAVGGLAGMAYNTVMDCNAHIQITIKNVKREHKTSMNMPFLFGGLLGVCDSAHIRNCSSNGAINISDSCTNIYVGGMIGYYFTTRQANTEIKESQTNIYILGDSYYAGGFIGRLDVYSDTLLQIADCSVIGDLAIGDASGFIRDSYVIGGKLSIEKCYVKNTIFAYHRAVGFIANSLNDKGVFKIISCSTVGQISTLSNDEFKSAKGYAIGFCQHANSIDLIYCFAKRDMSALYVFGFSQDFTGCYVNSCFYAGEISIGEKEGSNGRGIGFAMQLSNTIVENCFVDLIVVNNSQSSKLNGFARYVDNSEVKNFYVVGQCAGELIYKIENSTIKNGHVLSTSCDLTLHNGIEVVIYYASIDMYNLAEILNGGKNDGVWINIENQYPKFKYNIS